MYSVFQKVLAMVLALFTLFSAVMPVTYAVSTNGQSAPWSREKAEHLGRKVLFAPISSKIDELMTAGSATAAVNLLFPDAVGPNRTQYDSEITAFVNSGSFNW